MLSAASSRSSRTRSATGWVNQRIVYTHGIGVAMVPVNEVGSEGQPQPVHRQPAAGLDVPARRRSPSRGSTSASGRASYVVDRRPGRTSSTTRPARPTRAARSATETRWTGTTGITLDTTLMRLLFAARFRDLDLLISDQVTADSQLLFHRSLSDRLPLIAPFLRYDKDPYLVIDGAGRLVYIQDAYTTSDRFPDAQPFDPGALDPTGLGDRRRSTTSATASRSRSTPTTARCTSTSPTRTTRSSAPTRASSRRCSSRSTAMPSDLARPPPRPRGAVQRPDPACSGATTSPTPQQFFRRDDLWTVPDGPDERADACRPRPTTSRCACPARPGSSSCSSSRWSRPAGRT